MTIEEVNTLPKDPYGLGYVYMELYGCMISPEDFITRFDGATLSYDDLYNHTNATEGWKNQFDDWKEQGILA
jgi:hypothetical protein